MPWFRLLVVLVLAALWPVRLGAQAVLEPPLGLHWGDSPEKLVAWASRHALDVVVSLPGDQPALRVLRVSARQGFLPGMQAGTVEARFLGGRLFEVALDYADPSAPAQVIETRFEKLKRQLTAEYGALTPNRGDTTVDDGFATRRISLHREPVRGLFLLLAFTEVEDTLRKSREARFSLLYRNDNLRRQVEADLAREAVPDKAPPGAPQVGG